MTTSDSGAQASRIIEKIISENEVSGEWTDFQPNLVSDYFKLGEQSNKKSLANLVVSVKDNINTLGHRTSFGSSLFKEYRPGNDARVVDSLRREGALIAGKVECAEFAVHTPGLARNPRDPRLSPGTSSGGSAASVANESADLSIGTQALGSIIKPASFCGVIGFKPSFGLIPRTGVLRTADTLDTVGFFSKSISIIQKAFEATRVKGADYPSSELIGLEQDFEFKDVSFVVLEERNDVDAPLQSTLSDIGKIMATLGCKQISLGSLTAEINESREHCLMLYSYELFKNIGADVLSASPGEVSNELKEVVNRGSLVS